MLIRNRQWLWSSRQKAETEGFILAAQDQSLLTKNYQANVLRNGASQNCRSFDDKLEMIDHIISGYNILVPNE